MFNEHIIIPRAESLSMPTPTSTAMSASSTLQKQWSNVAPVGGQCPCSSNFISIYNCLLWTSLQKSEQMLSNLLKLLKRVFKISTMPVREISASLEDNKHLHSLRPYYLKFIVLSLSIQIYYQSAVGSRQQSALTPLLLLIQHKSFDTSKATRGLRHYKLQKRFFAQLPPPIPQLSHYAVTTISLFSNIRQSFFL